MVSPLGLVSVDGTSGRQDLVGAVERLIIDPTHYWRASLGDIHLAFDGELGALCLLNTKKEEIYWLWFNNGAVTSLSDCPFEFVTEGPDPAAGGTDRSWFSGPSGSIYHVNFDRTSSVQAMCGGAGDEVFNAQVGGQGDIVTDTDDSSGVSAFSNDELSCAFVNYDFTVASTARQTDWPTLPQNLVGFYMYVLSGTHRGEKRKITAIGTNWAGSNPPAASHTLPVVSYVTIDRPLGHTGNDLDVILGGETVSFAPIIYKAGFSSMRDGPKPDLYSRKHTHSMTVLAKTHVGEAKRFRIPTNLQIYEDIFGRPQEQSTYLYEDPGRNQKSVQKTGNTLFPAVEALHGNTDFELRSVRVEGTIGPTQAVTDS